VSFKATPVKRLMTLNQGALAVTSAVASGVISGVVSISTTVGVGGEPNAAFGEGHTMGVAVILMPSGMLLDCTNLKNTQPRLC
jgi:hypothetical protein